MYTVLHDFVFFTEVFCCYFFFQMYCMLPFVVHVVKMWSSTVFIFVLLLSQPPRPYSVSAREGRCEGDLQFYFEHKALVHQFCPFCVMCKIWKEWGRFYFLPTVLVRISSQRGMMGVAALRVTLQHLYDWQPLASHVTRCRSLPSLIRIHISWLFRFNHRARTFQLFLTPGFT